MNLVDEFNMATKQIVRNLKFDCDCYVSTFEVNIRVLGYPDFLFSGLIAGHLSAVEFKKINKKLAWYKDELLKLAIDLGNILHKAFNTETGIPYRLINPSNGSPFFFDETNCVACGGTFVLEFGALTILTGNTSYIKKAIEAMDFIWLSRQPNTDLVGSMIHIYSGQWINFRSSIGSESDSYFEYLLKGYAQFSSYQMLDRFSTHYEAIFKHLKYNHGFYDINLNKLNSSYSYTLDSLRAFFPGIQVMYGDVDEAVIYHNIFHHLVKKHVFLPETLSFDYKIVNADYKQRPEFIESTYYIYLATQDPYYYDIATETIDNVEIFLRTPCGYASVENLTTFKLGDRMETFLVSELFKYLYLMLEPSLPFDLSKYIFSTEAHIMPKSNGSFSKPGRKSLGNLFKSNDITYKSPEGPDADATAEYIKINYLINNLWKQYLRVSSEFLERKSAILRSSPLFNNYLLLKFTNLAKNQSSTFVGSIAQFGPYISPSNILVNVSVSISDPLDGCNEISGHPTKLNGVLVILRGRCSFIVKVKNAQNAGARAVVIVDDQAIAPYSVPSMVHMSGDGVMNESEIKIPSVFVHPLQGSVLASLINQNASIDIFDTYTCSLVYE
ncbi:ER degradation-enhancing alpha-mannosidase-like protein 3 [Thelohanellus kitauei]|uniref:alpha-1,2-Mannosidase n=1 Tax=Thelohanellus kitauei TaxID=669202 RepID=A0A0C2IKW5_THEKT|nr:ER degradation-enhancing alpha-mannosidase-like protein 3 [Thelohanellus kitauei]